MNSIIADIKHITIGAATFSGNQGAASMLHSTIQQLSESVDDVEFSVFTVYPGADKKLNTYKNVSVYSAKPKRLVTVLIPISFLYKFLPFLRNQFNKIDGIKAIAEADIHIDLAGISFADGRRKFLIYNVASVLPLMFMKVPVVKFSQAMGPFKDWVNKLVAKLFLKKFKQIFARGAKTRQSLDDLDITNVSDASDVAFLFEPRDSGKLAARRLLKRNQLKKGEYLVFSPSQVLNKKAEKQGIDYVTKTANIIDKLTEETNLPIVILPHAIRDDNTKHHNNDIPVVLSIYEKIKNKKNCVVVTNELYADGIKQVIKSSKLVIAARFHAMIGALSTGTPVVVTGWSHKYQEVLDSFKLNLPVVYLDEKYQQNTFKQTILALNEVDKLSEQITKQLDTIRKDAKVQIEYVTAILND